MTEPKRRPNLLPPDHTKRERALADVDGRLDDIDAGLIERAKDPFEAPAAYLPYLAWERSVDVYDPAWPEGIRRAVIAAAPTVHRYKGTRYAVEATLAALQIDAHITEWWQASPRGAPYTFHVTVYARARLYDGPLLDARLIRVVYGAILAAKPESRAFDFAVGAGFPARLGIAPAVTARTRLGVTLRPEAREVVLAGLGLAPALIARQRLSLTLIGRLDE